MVSRSFRHTCPLSLVRSNWHHGLSVLYGSISVFTTPKQVLCRSVNKGSLVPCVPNERCIGLLDRRLVSHALNVGVM